MARNFDGATNLDLQGADAAVMHVVEPFAVGLWYKGSQGLVGNFKYLLSKLLLAGNHPSFGFSTNGTEDLRFLQGHGTGVGQFVISPTIASATAFDAQWHYLMGSADGSNVRIYLDGVEQGAGTAQLGATAYSNLGLYVGSFDGATSSLYYNGGLAEIALFDAIPNAAERAALAKGYSPLAVKPASVVMYWPLLGKYAPEIDVVGHVDLTNNGTIQANNSPRLILRPTSPVGQPAAAGGTVSGTLAAALGGLTGTLTGTRTGHGTFAGPLGALSGTLAGTITRHGQFAADLGGLAATLTGDHPATTVVETGSWYTLLDILNEARAEAAAERSRPFVACPNDGEPLLSGPRGELYCPFDGWRPGTAGSPGGWF